MINKLLGSSYECCSRKIIDGDAVWPGFNPDLGFRLELSDLSEKKENNWDPNSTHPLATSGVSNLFLFYNAVEAKNIRF